MNKHGIRMPFHLKQLLFSALVLWLVTVLLLVLSPDAHAAGRSIYVAPGGSNNNSGNFSNPLRTIQAAVDLANPGDTVYVRAGTYLETVKVTRSGTSGNPITINAYPGESPVIDGSAGVNCLNCGLPNAPIITDQIDPNTGRGFNWSSLVSIQGDHIVFEGFIVKRSMGRGIQVLGDHWRVSDVTVRNNRVLDSRVSGILVEGNEGAEDILIENNVVRHAGSYAPWVDGRDSSVDWPVALLIKNSDNVTVRGNTVYENWGEGIAPGFSTNVTVEDNIIFDNFALQLYVHRAEQMTVQRNLLYHTNNPDFRRGGNPPACIVVNNESQFEGYLVTKNIDIINNIAIGCSQNFAVWDGSDGQGFERFLVAHNTFVNAVTNSGNTARGISFADADYRNFRFENNVIYQKDTSDSPKVGRPDSDVSFAYNLWYPNRPENGGGSGLGDVVGQDPQFTDSRVYELPENWSQKPERSWFRIKSSSPAIDQGRISQPFMSGTDIFFDLFWGLRDLNPDIGIHEYGSPSPKPKKSFSPIQRSKPVL